MIKKLTSPFDVFEASDAAVLLNVRSFSAVSFFLTFAVSAAVRLVLVRYLNKVIALPYSCPGNAGELRVLLLETFASSYCGACDLS